MASSGEGVGDPAAARRRWDLTNKGAESTLMVKEVVEMSTDEEPDGAVICHLNGNTDGCDEAISGNHDDDSREGQVTTPIKDPDVEVDTQEDKCVNQDSLKLVDQEKSAPPKSSVKSVSSGSERPKRVVPQPFSLSTQRRSSGGNGGVNVTNPFINKERSGDKSSISPASMTKKSTPVAPRKNLQPEQTFHPQEEDSFSVTSSTTTSTRAGRTKTTVPVAPSFVCANRADKRKEEEQEATLKQLRKSLVIRAKPMPSFYQEGPPPKAELKKVPPTRAKSPKFTSSRRKSCNDTLETPEGKNTNATSTRSQRHSIGSSKDTNRVQCSPKSGVAIKTRAVKPELKAI
ncbi:hypothetical protein U9M48_010845 [Paspalum notatum var. saurae]|uniref:TPX2 C-terminal domain-containing protein n=1 Tax=Paspalum notatum var. saurae TaxID=547442 RepID=A0AAQ3SU77_PASNO